MNPRLFIKLSRITLGITVVTIFILSVIRTGPELPGGISDKVYHALAFFVLSILSGISFPEKRQSLVLPVCLLMYGVAIEIVQYYIPYRSFSLEDMIADGAGIVVYLILLKLFSGDHFLHS